DVVADAAEVRRGHRDGARGVRAGRAAAAAREERAEVHRTGRGCDLADRRRLHARGQRKGNRLTDVRTDLEGRAAERTVKKLAAVERRLGGDAVDFSDTLLHFLVERVAVAGAVSRVGRLH